MEKNADKSIKLIGRKRRPLFLIYTLDILSFGIVYCLRKWINNFEISLLTTVCPIENSDIILIEDYYKNIMLVNVQIINALTPTLKLKRYIRNKSIRIIDTPHGRFIYDYLLGKYDIPKYEFNHRQKNFSEILSEQLFKTEKEERIELYEKAILFGENNVGVTVPTVSDVFFENIIDPFFLWEMGTLVLWIAIEYCKYAFVVGSIYFFLLIKRIISDLSNRNNLAEMNKLTEAKVFRRGQFVSMCETDIYPGDLILIETVPNFVCDCEILSGEVIVEESFLTGEPVPISKIAGQIVYSGTKVLNSTLNNQKLEYPNNVQMVPVKSLIKVQNKKFQYSQKQSIELDDFAIGIVLKTGKNTKRGFLSKNLVIKRPIINKFAAQSIFIMKYLLIITVILTIIMGCYLSKFLSFTTNMEFTLDLAISFFSPSLHSTLELGAQYARDQLAKKNVNTTETDRINTAGEVDMIVFDKTGTLTELGVDILNIDTIDSTIESIENIDPIIHMGLSTCHYVLELDNQYSGDILDMKMFLFSRSKIVNREGKRFIDLSSNNEYVPICKEQNSENEADSVLFFDSVGSKTTEENFVEVLKIHDFDLYVKRISVVVKTKSGKMYLFCKGAPDSICKILQSVPEEYNEKVKEYSLQGHRVLTMAYKEISEYGKREVDESELKFIGFIVFANRLKEETEGVIKELREANIHPKMCTGDNILTAISVARECKMIDSDMPVLFPVVEENLKTYHDADWFCVADEDYVFDKIKMELYMDFDRTTAVDFVVAIEGKEFEFFRSTVYHSFILEKGVVFARFNPDNKKELIEDYSNNNYVTMFCGDGANDTGALSSADVGLSLSTNEASLAASFNSRNITAALDLIKEGRSALSMSASQFKYVFYSQVLAGLQMFVLLPYLYFPSDMMSLVSDLMSVYLFGYLLSNFKAAKKIDPKKINIHLGKNSLHIIIELFFIFVVYLLVALYTGKSTQTDSIKVDSTLSTILYPSTFFLLIYKVFSYADFIPHRQPRRTNYIFLSIIMAATIFGIILVMNIALHNPKVLEYFEFAKLSSGEIRISISVIFISVLISILFDILLRQ